MGGNIGLIEEGDTIDIDIENGTLNVEVSEEELEKRRAKAVVREPNVKKGWLRRYAKMVAPASKGAIMDDEA